MWGRSRLTKSQERAAVQSKPHIAFLVCLSPARSAQYRLDIHVFILACSGQHRCSPLSSLLIRMGVHRDGSSFLVALLEGSLSHDQAFLAFPLFVSRLFGGQQKKVV